MCKGMDEDCICLLVEASPSPFAMLSLSVKEFVGNKRAQTFDTEVKAREGTSNVKLGKHVRCGR